MNRNIADLVTATAFDRDGEKLGSVTEVYINDTTGQPDFVEVAHGLFGMDSSIVPLRGHRLDGENLQLAFSKDLIKDAPTSTTRPTSATRNRNASTPISGSPTPPAPRRSTSPSSPPAPSPPASPSTASATTAPSRTRPLTGCVPNPTTASASTAPRRTGPPAAPAPTA